MSNIINGPFSCSNGWSLDRLKIHWSKPHYGVQHTNEYNKIYATVEDHSEYGPYAKAFLYSRAKPGIICEEEFDDIDNAKNWAEKNYYFIGNNESNK